jgi:uncharacterized protein YoxC
VDLDHHDLTGKRPERAGMIRGRGNERAAKGGAVIGSIWSALGGLGAIIAAVAWAALVVFLAIMVFQLAVVLRGTATLIDEMREETVPLLHEVTGTVRGVNKELERVDGMVESAGHIVKNAERISSVVEQAVSSPLIKVIAFGAGASRAMRRIRKKKES